MAILRYQERSVVKLLTSVLFSCMGVLTAFLETASCVDSGFSNRKEEALIGRQQRDVSPTAETQQVRLHPGVVASVVIVSLAAVVAAVYIIRKYCFPQNDAVFRYSVLRQLEEQSTSVSEEHRSESDEELLE